MLKQALKEAGGRYCPERQGFLQLHTWLYRRAVVWPVEAALSTATSLAA